MLISPKTLRLLKILYEFEATESQADTGAGSRREGADFEELISQMWESVVDFCISNGARQTYIQASKSGWSCLAVAGCRLYLPDSRGNGTKADTGKRWLTTEYQVQELIAAYPGVSDAVQRYSPDDGPYAAANYHSIYKNLTTRFDGVILKEEDGILREKILLEYKTAKSSKGERIDGNAHERLSFQIMQYLEVATRYPKCSLMVFANGAFVQYKNKYHVNFHVQADRLQAFSWFNMHYACTENEYLYHINNLLSWLWRSTL
jgi:hypothetical protein